MVTKALLVRLEAHPGQGDAVKDFLVWARLLVEEEPGTKPWLAVPPPQIVNLDGLADKL